MADIETRVQRLEDWRDDYRDLIARQQVMNEQLAISNEKLTTVIEDHEKRLVSGEIQRALIVNTGKAVRQTIGIVGGVLAILIPLMNALIERWLQ